MLLQAALNGDRTTKDHQAVPITSEELSRDAVACVAAGAGAFHIHPRDAAGTETFDARVIDRVTSAVREACGVPVGVSTGAWIEPDLHRRLQLIRAWTVPDYATVNLSEEGALDVIRTLLDAGVGVEAGIWTVEDAHRLAGSGLAEDVVRICVEPVDPPLAEAVALVGRIHRTLDQLRVPNRRLQHADGASTWVVLRDALERGYDIRIGLEDTLLQPDGRLAPGNPSLVRAASGLAAEVLDGKRLERSLIDPTPPGRDPSNPQCEHHPSDTNTEASSAVRFSNRGNSSSTP
jgi:uncharacterized protein (DUF849 family)